MHLIAALPFFIDDHVGDDKLPSEVLKTSQLMKWNQPPKKEIAPTRAQDIIFINLSHHTELQILLSYLQRPYLV